MRKVVFQDGRAGEQMVVYTVHTSCKQCLSIVMGLKLFVSSRLIGTRMKQKSGWGSFVIMGCYRWVEEGYLGIV